MKKLLFLSFFAAVKSLIAQSPQKINYQAVVRNSTNDLVINAQVGLRLSVLKGSANGKAVYVETHKPNTNANGLFSIEIGSGIPVTNTMDSINWSTGTYFLKTEVDPAGGMDYIISNISQFLSVPYAEYSSQSGGLTDYAVYEEQYPNSSALPKLNAGTTANNYVSNLHKFNTKVFQKGSSISLSTFSGFVTLQPGLYSVEIQCPIQAAGNNYSTNTYCIFSGSSSNQLSSHHENFLEGSSLQIIKGLIDVKTAEIFSLYQYVNTNASFTQLNSAKPTVNSTYSTIARITIIKL